MNRRVRYAIVAFAIVLVPLTIYHSTSILVALMNFTRTPSGYVHHVDVSYGNDPAHRLDVYVPEETIRAPVIIFWHGGMWKQGSKDDVRFVGAELARSGYVTVIPNYRLYPQVRFPTFLDDAARSVAWVRKKIASFAGDPNAIFLMGHSAGAYIATMLAFDNSYLAEYGQAAKCIRGVIGMAGPYTLERPAVLVDSIFDKSSESPWRPIDAVSAVSPPVILMHGQSDNIVWIDEARAMADRLGQLAIPVDLRIYPDRSHQDILVALWWPMKFRTPVLQDVRQFVDLQLARDLPTTACVPEN